MSSFVGGIITSMCLSELLIEYVFAPIDVVGSLGADYTLFYCFNLDSCSELPCYVGAYGGDK